MDKEMLTEIYFKQVIKYNMVKLVEDWERLGFKTGGGGGGGRQ